jgi:hypothetical protein
MAVDAGIDRMAMETSRRFKSASRGGAERLPAGINARRAAASVRQHPCCRDDLVVSATELVSKVPSSLVQASFRGGEANCAAVVGAENHKPWAFLPTARANVVEFGNPYKVNRDAPLLAVG